MTSASGAAMGFAEVDTLLRNACLACGFTEANAESLVAATLSAHQCGALAMGLPHFIDYLEAAIAGRIEGRASPTISCPLPAVIAVDASGGIAQAGFDVAFTALVKNARTFGLGLFTQRNSYTAGELGYYVRRLAAEGLVALATTNGPALMAAAPKGSPVYCTNPLAFGAPGGSDGGQLVIDQASSATAFVKLAKAAEAGETIPEGWAIDAEGEPTIDAVKALKGAMLPFGGARGANIALIVEFLSAGISGANWSLDAGDFRSGNRTPGIGLTVIALMPPAGFEERSADQLQRLEKLAVHIPGKRSANPPSEDLIQLDITALTAIRRFAARSAAP